MSGKIWELVGGPEDGKTVVLGHGATKLTTPEGTYWCITLDDCAKSVMHWGGDPAWGSLPAASQDAFEGRATLYTNVTVVELPKRSWLIRTFWWPVQLAFDRLRWWIEDRRG